MGVGIPNLPIVCFFFYKFNSDDFYTKWVFNYFFVVVKTKYD